MQAYVDTAVNSILAGMLVYIGLINWY